MIPTTDFLYSKFDEFNTMFFNDELPFIKITVNRSKNCHGCFHSVICRDCNNVKHQRAKLITISKYYDVSAKEIEETLIHEMIHYYICHKAIKDNNSHGYKFREIAKQISDSSEYDITIFFDNTSAKLTRSYTKDYYYVTFSYMGHNYWSRVSKPLADKCLAGLFNNRYLKDCEVYKTTDDAIDRFSMCTKRLKTYSMTALPNVKSVRVR